MSEMERVLLDCPLAMLHGACRRIRTVQHGLHYFCIPPAAEGDSLVLRKFGVDAAYGTSYVCVKWYYYCTLPIAMAARS